jgi:hypothetical protein
VEVLEKGVEVGSDGLRHMVVAKLDEVENEVV